MADSWQFIPDDTLDAEQRQQTADAWAQRQRSAVAAEWAQLHTADAHAMASRYGVVPDDTDPGSPGSGAAAPSGTVDVSQGYTPTLSRDAVQGDLARLGQQQSPQPSTSVPSFVDAARDALAQVTGSGQSTPSAPTSAPAAPDTDATSPAVTASNGVPSGGVANLVTGDQAPANQPAPPPSLA